MKISTDLDQRSTGLAITKIIEDITLTTAIDRNKYTIGVFIDLKKAFDTIDHQLLISKLYAHGIRGVVLDWLTSYLQYNNDNNMLSWMVIGQNV